MPDLGRNDRARVLILDIETTDLSADIGYALCVGSKWLGEKAIRCPSLMDYAPWANGKRTDDKPLLKDVYRECLEADIIVSFYGGPGAFDWRFLQGRMVIQQIGILPPALHFDLLFNARAKMKFRSNSLFSLERSLDLKNRKSPLDPEVWNKAKSGDEASFRKVITHCKKDVLVTEELYYRTRGLSMRHPRVTTDLEACRACGGRVIRRGYGVTRLKNRPIRVQCVNPDCGTWETRVLARSA
jgi:uncharacterized protein YprB with RNaseH-like and TPR domain